jgi:spore coat protein U-like protein
VIEWHPGFKRYQLQQTATMGQPWQNVGEPTTATSITNSVTSSAQFFRVIGLLE